MLKCEICNKEFSLLSGLAVHLSRTHKVNHKDYYDKYLKQPNEDKCLFCGKATEYLKWSYKNYCSRTCQFRHNEPKMLTTMQNRYGTQYAAQNTELRAKMEQTCLDKYNVKSCFHTSIGKKHAKKNHKVTEQQIHKTKQTNLSKYGTECTLCTSKAIKNSHNSKANQKRKQTSLQHFGTEHPTQSTQVKSKIENTMLNKYGVKNGFQTEKAIKNKNSSKSRRKANFTMKKKGHKSKAEDLLAKTLNKYKVSYETEYTSDVYPFNCDFYIIEKDLYIEINIYPMHNKHFFDETNLDDLDQLNKFKEKAETSKWYQKLIEVWTVRDPLKYKAAIKNKLNYIVIWNYNDLYNFINNIKNYLN